MRKQIIDRDDRQAARGQRQWLGLEELAQVEVTSEDPAHPVESALAGNRARGWRAAAPGKQTIRIIFDEPQKISHIALTFREPEHQRTQEFVLRWSDAENSREIVRQQYNFSPPETILEQENYDLALERVKSLEVVINPDISGGSARASLERLDLAS